MLLPRAAAAARARLAPRTALSTVTESAPWYKRPLSLSSSESGWQLAVATWGFIIFVGVPWSYNRMLALTAPDPATRVTRHKDTVQQMVYELRCASCFFLRVFPQFLALTPRNDRPSRRNPGPRGEQKPWSSQQRSRLKGRAIDDRRSAARGRARPFCKRL